LIQSPIPQSIIVGLEGFSSNDLNYNREMRDSAEIIWYDFKEQALDLIHDIGIYLDNFEGTIDPKIHFLDNHLEQMGYWMRWLMVLGIKGHMLSARILLVMKISWF